MTNKKIPRGIRNNNPGNIRYNGTAWKGLATPPTDGAFCIFTHPEFGLRALAKLLRNYNRYYGIRTIKSIINRFAPDTENNTTAYIQSVCKATGFADYQQLDLEVESVLLPLMKAIIKHENGQQPYSDQQILESIKC
ncbi:MAG: structural protein [Alphaproteobacteria bacterium]|nr:structural protein [Alphaproteobacteria bacterium]